MSNITAVPSAARTASGAVELAGLAEWSSIRTQLEVTAASGTSPTLDVVVEDSLDGTTWNVVGTFAQATAVTREVIDITGLFSDRLRVSWTVAGTTPSFEFNVRMYGE